MGKLVKGDLLNDVYNLVLSVDIKEEERQVLLKFKNAVENGKDFDKISPSWIDMFKNDRISDD